MDWLGPLTAHIFLGWWRPEKSIPKEKHLDLVMLGKHPLGQRPHLKAVRSLLQHPVPSRILADSYSCIQLLSGPVDSDGVALVSAQYLGTTSFVFT